MTEAIELKPLVEIYDSLYEKLKRTEGGPEISLRSLPTLNKKIMGLSKGRMYIIGGRTSQGKTTLALQIAMDLARQGKRVYFLSFEMDQEEIMLRMLSNMCEIDANDIRFNISKHVSMTDKLRQFLADGDFPMLLTYNIGLTVKELNHLIADLPTPDLVIVDYIQAIRKIDFDKLTSINNYIMDFRRLCVEHNFCGILVSQINRDAMDLKEKKPALWQLKGSGTLEEHADVVMLVHWEHFYTSTTDKNKFIVLISKNRQGMVGSVDLNYFPEFYKFKDIGEKLQPGTLLQLTPEQHKQIQMFGGRVVND
jgi:replicative DNA helicase